MKHNDHAKVEENQLNQSYRRPTLFTPDQAAPRGYAVRFARFGFGRAEGEAKTPPN